MAPVELLIAGGGKRDQGEHAAQAVLALSALKRDLGV